MSIALADIKSFLEIDSIADSIVTVVLNGVVAFVEQYTGKKMSVDTVDVVENYNGDGSQILFLKNYPIKTVSEVAYNTGTRTTPTRTVISADSYYPDNNKGQIVFPSMSIPRGFGNIKVTYRAGYETLPANLELAIKLLCGNIINKKDAQGIDSESVQGTSLSYSKEEMSDEIKQLLDPYRSFNV